MQRLPIQGIISQLNTHYSLCRWLWLRQIIKYTDTLQLPLPLCVSRTAVSGSTAQHVGNVWNHVCIFIHKSCQMHLKFSFWITFCILVIILLHFVPPSMETLSVLWPLCPSRPPMWPRPRKGGLLQLWQPGAQTQRLPSQRLTQDQQVSSENRERIKYFRLNIYMSRLIPLSFVCLCVFKCAVIGPKPRVEAKMYPIILSSSLRVRGSLAQLAEQRRQLLS